MQKDDTVKTKGYYKTVLWIKTISLIIVWFSMGMSNVLTPTTLPDIRKRLDVDVEQISRSLAIGGIGGIIGAPLGSLADRYSQKVDAILSGCLFVCAISIGTRCLTTSLPVFTVEIFIDGLSWTIVNSAGNSLLMDMWGEKGGAPMHALHFGYPLGAMIGPLIAYPFVSEEVENISMEMNYSSTESVFTTEATDSRYKDGSQIEIAFGIVGIFIGVLAIVFLIYQFIIPSSEIAVSHNKGGFKWKDVLSPSKWAEGDSKFGISMVIFVMAFYALHIATLKGSSTYYVTYAVDQVGYTNQEAALFSSLANFAGTLGRGIAIILAKFIPIQVMFIAEVHGQALSGILTLIWGLDNKVSFLVFCSFFYFFRDPIWPSGYTWTDQYIALYAIVVGIIDMAAKTTDVFFSWLLGYLYTYTVPDSLFYNTVVAGVLLCVLVIIMNIFGERHGRRFKKNDETENPNLTDGFKVMVDSTLEIMVNSSNNDVESTKL